MRCSPIDWMQSGAAGTFQMIRHGLHKCAMFWAVDGDLGMQVDKILQFVLVMIRAVDMDHALYKLPERKPPLATNPVKGASSCSLSR